MDIKERERLAAFRHYHAELRKKQWVQTILKARTFTSLDTLQQGLSFSEDLEDLRRRRDPGRS